MIGWTLDLLFGRHIEQMVTLRDVKELTGRPDSNSRAR